MPSTFSTPTNGMKRVIGARRVEQELRVPSTIPLTESAIHKAHSHPGERIRRRNPRYLVCQLPSGNPPRCRTMG